MTLQQITEEVKTRETARFNYKGSVQINESGERPCFSGSIRLETNPSVRLGYNPDYVDEAKPLEIIVKKDPFEQAFTSLADHEFNHKGGGEFRGCPRNLDLHVEDILEPMAKTLKEQGIPNVPVSNGQSLYQYFANMFEDFVDNSEIGNKAEHIGMFLAYKDDAEHSDERKFPALFEAFVKLQEKFYGGKRSKKLLGEHYRNEEEPEEVVDNFMGRTQLDQFKREKKTRRKKQNVELFDRKKAMDYCLDKKNWKELASIFAEEFAKLIDKDKLQEPGYVQAMFIPLKGEEDGFSDELNDPETRMKFAWKKYQESSDGESQAEFQPPAFMDNFEALDLVYQKLAREMEIKSRRSTRADSMPVMHYGRKEFDPKKDKLSKARVRLGKKGNLELTVKPYHEDFPVEYESRKQNIPSIRFVQLDTSGSMTESVDYEGEGKVMNSWADERKQWDNNSRYHHGLVAWYSLLELLRKQGTLRHKSVKFANYSDSTKVASNLRDAKKLALTPQFGGTELDVDDVTNLLGRNELVLSISDGQISNWNGIKEKYIEAAKQNEYIHFQMGNFSTDDNGKITNKPGMCGDLEEAGLPVYYDNGKNLGKMVVDLTRPYVTRS